MAKAVADPGELRRFAADLKKFNTEIQGQMAALQARFGALETTWRDQEHAKFAEEFDQTTKVLKRFLKVSETQIPFLLRKAQRLEDYLTTMSDPGNARILDLRTIEHFHLCYGVRRLPAFGLDGGERDRCTINWLEGEVIQHWRVQIRKRQDLVTMAGANSTASRCRARRRTVDPRWSTRRSSWTGWSGRWNPPSASSRSPASGGTGSSASTRSSRARPRASGRRNDRSPRRWPAWTGCCSSSRPTSANEAAPRRTSASCSLASPGLRGEAWDRSVGGHG